MVLSRFFTVVAACAILVSAPVLANEVQDINQQFRKGDLSGALSQANRYLAKNPKDAQARFLKGLILADLGKTNDAITVFTGLTEDFPELPEPYNNLAVLYASQSKYDAAKNALEMAIRTHPSYATAHENLGDIYAKMASIAYDKALSLDSKNTAAQTKLSLIQDMIQGQPRKAVATKPTAAPSRPVAPPAVTSSRPVASPAVASSRPVASPAVAQPEPAKPSSSAPAPANKAIETAVNRWAQAWSARDVKAYLAAYASDYSADGMSRSDWEAQRHARVGGPKHIDVQLSDLTIDQQGDAASAMFRQAYRSDRFSSTVTKTLKLALKNGQWLIVDEDSK